MLEAKTHFSNLIQRVQDGEQITICKHNTPVAKIIPIIQKPKTKAEDIVKKFAEFNKDKILAPYTIKELWKVVDASKTFYIRLLNNYVLVF